LKELKENPNLKGIVFGTAIGTAIGVSLDNFAIGLGIGFVFAIALIKKEKTKE